VLIDSDYIDLALAMAVVFFLSSLVVSGLNEGLQLLTRVRSKFLWAYLYELTTPEPERTRKGLPRGPGQILSFWWPGKPSWWHWWWPSRRANVDPRPSVTDTAPTDERHDTAALLASLGPLDVPQLSGREYRPTSIKHIPTSRLAGGLLEVLAGSDQIPPAEGAASPTVHDRIEQGVMGRAGTPIGPTLHRLWRTAERDMERFRDGLERWLDGEMSRLGGLYKRTVRWILAIIALVVAVVLNIDTVGLAGDLWENPAGRSALVAQAEGLAVSDQGDPSAGAGDTALLRLRQACESAAGEEGQGEGTAVDQAAAAVADVRACLNDAFDDLNQLDITGDSLTNGWQGWQQTWTGDAFSSKEWYLHMVGVLALWAALVVGSQFWFDVIKRLTGIRAGKVGDT
jgi:hypothetical protein